VSDVGDAIELTYTTAPSATVVMSWVHVPSGAVLQSDVAVPELVVNGVHTGQYPITLVGSLPGMYEAIFTSYGTATTKESYFERFDAVGGPAPLTTVGEYTDLYGSLSAAKASTCRALIKRASQLVRDSYPGIDDKIEAGTVAADSVGLAVLNMVARVMRNPDGLRSQAIGPISRSFDTDLATGMLEITAAEAVLLVPPVVTGGRNTRNKMGTARITGGMVPKPAPHRRWRNGPYFGPGGH
jgi:hypothetical protein